MDESQAMRAFAALAQDTRLGILRMLVQTGPQGRAAGEIAEIARVSPSNVSFHLKELERAGLVSQRREARSIIYAAAYPAITELIQFLMQDCCGGHPEICAPAISNPCCASDTTSAKKETTDA